MRSSLWMVVLCACGTPLPRTLGEGVEEMLAAVCLTAIECAEVAPDVTQDECVEVLYEDYCRSEGADCSEPADPQFTRAEWNDCLRAIETMPCVELDDGLPRECRGLEL